MRKIELLAPAKDLECGIEAIRHGADAVYIGGPYYGARAAAGNSVADIQKLCDYAHTFEVKIYITLNTILWDNELKEVEKTIKSLYDVGVDALIVQDMALLNMDLPPIALHASTQMDNRTPEKAKFLERAGLSQIVLARELPLAEIRRIHEAVDVPLEVFVHGALCVSYSGQCYASHHCFGRSANRGNCAQFCRMSFDLVDGKGNELIHDKHLLSLRDMNRSEDLEAMLDAGVSSFKIEGRLKNAAYVKNVTAYYRQKLDEILDSRRGDYQRASFGTTKYQFIPNLKKSFNRDFTDYFLHGKRTAIYQFDTPKAMGEAVGEVVHVDKRRGTFTVMTPQSVTLSAGDGLCFLDTSNHLQGCRVNKVEGNVVSPNSSVPVFVGAKLYRNLDFQFNKTLAKPTAGRKLRLNILLVETTNGYRLEFTDEMGEKAQIEVPAEHTEALTPQEDNIRHQLQKLGNTPFLAEQVKLELKGNRFIPSSALANWRRTAIEALLEAHKQHYNRPPRYASVVPSRDTFIKPHLDYTANVSNALAKNWYEEHGAEVVDDAFELHEPNEAMLMTCKYCLRHALKACLKRPQEASKLTEPLMLRMANGQRFRLSFDCKNCQMKVYATE